MKKDTINLLKIIKGNIYDLAGDSNKNIRRAILSDLLNKKMPKSKCGIYAIETALLQLAGLKNFQGCHREQSEALLKWIEQL